MKVLVETLRVAQKGRIESAPWTGAETRQASQTRFAAFGVKIGYPNRCREDSGLPVERASYFESATANAFEARRNRGKLSGPFDRAERGMTPPT